MTRRILVAVVLGGVVGFVATIAPNGNTGGLNRGWPVAACTFPWGMSAAMSVNTRWETDGNGIRGTRPVLGVVAFGEAIGVAGNLAAWLIVSLAALVGWESMARWRNRRQLHFPRCANCGYNLTGNISGACPECGTNVEG